jgi:DNA polymerase-1
LLSYQDLDGVYSHLEELSPSIQNKMKSGRDAAYLSQKLARIVTDLDIPLDLDRARVDCFDPARVEELFRELEFRTLMTRLTNLERALGKRQSQDTIQLSMFEAAKTSIEPVAGRFIPEASGSDSFRTVVVDTPESLEKLSRELESARVLSFDTETTSTDQMRAELVGLSLAIQADRGFYIPVGHTTGSDVQLPLTYVLDALRKPLTDPSIPKVGHNIKYDFVVLARYGLRVNPLTFDTMIAEWVINPASRNLGLKNLAWIRLGLGMTRIEELIGKGKRQVTMAELTVAQVADYAAADAYVVLRLMPELESELKERHADKLFRELEMPLVSVLANMEMQGVALDIDFLSHMSKDLSQRLVVIEKEIYEAVGKPFNLNSPQQLSEALFERLRIAPADRTHRTATGFYSTAADVLEAMRGEYPVVDLVLEYRELSKLKSTYLDALPAQVNPLTGRVHTSFNQTGSVTGRLASSDPNLQNIPIRTEIGRQVRKAFIASPDDYMLSVDYSQIELRIVAHMANDEAMLNAFRAEQDIHAATAAAIYGVPLEKVDKDQRRRAKGVNFGLIYGMSAFGLTRYADLTLAEAEDFMSAYFKRFPGVKNYLDGMRRLAAEQGYVETLLGRRRYFPALKNLSDRNQRNREEREAINAPIQGTAADIMKIAMIRLPDALGKAGLEARMTLQVHDELVLECPVQELARTASVVKTIMESAYQLAVPLSTDARYGPNWDQMEPVNP